MTSSYRSRRQRRPRHAAPTTRTALASTLVLVCVGVGLGGCAGGKRPDRGGEAIGAAPATTQASTETVRLDDLEPRLELPAPATQPATRPSRDVLILYAQGRDALLSDRKQAAIEKLEAAAEADPASAVVQRDLGYALLGIDNARAAAAFRQAIAYNPADADSRVQLARTLINGTPKREPEAIEHLRLARLSPMYGDADGLSAVIDLMLGRLLETHGYRMAALDCYEHVLSTLDRKSLQLRGRPELIELLQRPGVLTLRVADLAIAAKQPERAIALYERLQKQEPQAAAMLELRIGRAHMDAGRVDEATRRGFNVVESFRGSRSVRAAFAKLFEHLGPRRALEELERVKPVGRGQNTNTLELLRADLLLRAGEPAEAIAALRRVDRFDLSAARLTVHAYRAANRPRDELLQELIGRTARLPRRWPAINRAWEMITHRGQAAPIEVSAIAVVKIPKEHEAARQFVVAQLLGEHGQPVAAKRVMSEARRLDGELVRGLLEQPEASVDIDVDNADPDDLLEMILDYRDDPELLAAAMGTLVRQGQKHGAAAGLQAAHNRLPGDAAIASTYAQMLIADERRPEALAVLERTAQQATSANELYVIASQYGAMGDWKTNEQVLRRALQLDGTNPSVCNDLGYVLADNGRELDFAESLLWKAVGAEPENPAYLDSLGWLLYKRGRFAEASKYLEQAVAASDPGDPVVLDHSADALHRIDMHDLARQRWTQAVEAIRQRSTSDPQLRLKVEQKLRQANAKQKVDVAPVASQGD